MPSSLLRMYIPQSYIKPCLYCQYSSVAEEASLVETLRFQALHCPVGFAGPGCLASVWQKENKAFCQLPSFKVKLTLQRKLGLQIGSVCLVFFIIFWAVMPTKHPGKCSQTAVLWDLWTQKTFRDRIASLRSGVALPHCHPYHCTFSNRLALESQLNGSQIDWVVTTGPYIKGLVQKVPREAA